MKNSEKQEGTLRRVEKWSSHITSILAVAVVVWLLGVGIVQAQAFTVLHAFGSDGSSPQAGPIVDGKGNLYGTTSSGGEFLDGTLYKFESSDNYTTLANFQGSGPGAAPVEDRAGNFYGTTYWDASKDTLTYGTVWKVGKNQKTPTTLFNFAEHSDGILPLFTSLALGSNGELYGVTVGEGPLSSGQCTPPLCGTLYKINGKTGKLTLLHVFGKGKDGTAPGQGLVRDASGNFYGSAACGGAYGLGMIFELTQANEYKVLHEFKGGKGTCQLNNGYSSVAGPWASGNLVFDDQGNLYGTAWSNGKYGLGMVFKLGKTGLTVLHDFTGKKDGANPWGGVVRDAKGNLYGVTSNQVGSVGAPNGNVFEIDSAGHFKVLHAFTNGADGSGPVGVALDQTGKILYGTATSGGDATGGTLFKLALK